LSVPSIRADNEDDFVWLDDDDLVLLAPGIFAGDEIVEEGDEDGAADAGASKNGPSRSGPDPEYQSGSILNERADLKARLRSAEELFGRKEWAQGFGLVDDVLAELSSPEHSKRQRQEAARRQREAAKHERERAAEEAARREFDNSGEVTGRGPRPAKQPAADEVGSDDELTPTVEVYSQDGILYTPVAEASRRIVRALPHEARALYQRSFEAPAREALDRARALPMEAALAELERIGSRYAFTISGQRAIEERAARLADHGRFAEAAGALELRLRLPQPAASEPEGGSSRAALLAHAAALHLLAGHPGRGQELLGEVRQRHSETSVAVRGSAVLGADVPRHELFAGLAGVAAESARAPSRWPSVSGSYSHGAAALAEEDLPPLGSEARWIHSLREVSRDESRSSGASRGTFPALQAVACDGLIFVRKQEALVAIDSRSGKERWHAELEVRARPAPSGDDEMMMINRVVGSSGDGSEDYSDLGAKSITVFRPAVSSTEASAGVSPEALDGAAEELDAQVIVIDRSSMAAFDRSGQARPGPNTICALDARTGKLRWRIGGDVTRRDPAHGLAFSAPPTPAGRNLLVAPASRESGFYLAGIEVDRTGRAARIRWLRRLYSFNASYFQRWNAPLLEGTSVAVEGGVAYSAPGNGVAAAVDAASGEVLWLSRYRSTLRQSAGARRWVHPQPLTADSRAGGVLIVSPADSDYLSALDAKTGALRWEKRIAALWGSQVRVLGAHDGKVLIADTRVRALSLDRGDEVFRSEEIGSPAGHGFLAAGRIYLPSSGGLLSVIDAGGGREVASLRIVDPRLPAGYAHSLFPLDGKLVALGSWGLCAIRPQEESWTLLSADTGRDRFQRARLLSAEGRDGEAIDIFFELLDEHRGPLVRERLMTALARAVSEAARAAVDPSPIRRLLEHKFLDAKGERSAGAVPERQSRLAWRLLEARIELARSLRGGIERFLELLGNAGQLARCPESNEVDVSVYASDVLRQVFWGRGPLPAAPRPSRPMASAAALQNSSGNPERAAVPPPAAEAPPLDRAAALEATQDLRAREEAKSRTQLEAAGTSVLALSKLATLRSHTEAAAEAETQLAVLAECRGDGPAALRHLRRLASDWPALAELPQITERIQRLESLEARELRFLGLGVSASAEKATERLPEDAWRETFWFTSEEGFLVAAAPGSEPLPAVLALRGGRLRAFNDAGKLLAERPLPGYPDLDAIRSRLQSHIEEPAVAHFRDGRLVLFTAAGCYGFDLRTRESSSPEDDSPRVLDTAAFKLRWVSSLPHALDAVEGRIGRHWGSVGLPAGGNFFPEVDFSPEGDPRVLLPNGEFFCVDRRTGKLLWKLRPEGCHVVGGPAVKGGWALVRTVMPPGMLRYRLPRAGERTTPVQFLPGPQSTVAAFAIEGIASVFQGQNQMLEVRAAETGRLLWARTTSSRLVYASEDAVWTTASGVLKARSLRSGRELEVVDLPESSIALAVFDDPALDRGGLTLVTSQSYSPLRSASAYAYSSQTQTGTGLQLLRLERASDGSFRRRWHSPLAGGPVTYDGSRRVLEDGRWLFAFNEQDPSSQKWYTRVVVLDPQSGDLHRWLHVGIAGRGTGQPPRFSVAAGGLAVGNAEGFGRFTLDLPPPAGEKEPGPTGSPPARSFSPELPRNGAGK
jgi:outer membrane protein assembly factor BamB